MKKRIGNCPACAAPVEFKLSTALVTVCDFCHTVVARGDKQLEDHGKVADLVDTGSPIFRGVTGLFRKKRFEVVGRVQYQHAAGGIWNEWYLQLPEERVAWLAEAQGKYYVTIERRIPDGFQVPDFDSLSAGHRIDLPGQLTLVVAEKGIARALSADGSIPWAFSPNAEHRFADLHGTSGEFATLEYSETQPRFFLGQEVTLAELELEGDNWQSESFTQSNTAALQVNCPHCAGPLKLSAPDQTLRVCCPSCHSLLDCQQGKLEYLQTLHTPVEKPLIPLGATGALFESEYTVIGFMTRYAVYEGKLFPWSEYLLFSPKIGFRWLVENKGHWSFVEPLPVTALPKVRGDRITLKGTTFRIYDRGIAYVKYIAGEFYWKVNAGEQVTTADYIAPPQMLSTERTTVEAGDELNVSLGTYVDKQILEIAFHLKDELPTAWSVGVIQPRPKYTEIWLLWIGFSLLLIVLDLSLEGLSFPVDRSQLLISLAAVSILPVILMCLNHQFEINRWKDSDYSPYAEKE